MRATVRQGHLGLPPCCHELRLGSANGFGDHERVHASQQGLEAHRVICANLELHLYALPTDAAAARRRLTNLEVRSVDESQPRGCVIGSRKGNGKSKHSAIPGAVRGGATLRGSFPIDVRGTTYAVVSGPRHQPAASAGAASLAPTSARLNVLRPCPRAC